jgi:hypothetical protein
VWADNTVGQWADSKFEVDLSKQITDATQYRLRFVGDGGRVSGIGSVRLLVGGAPAEQLIRQDPAAKNALILTMTEIGQTVVVSGKIEGAERGTILMKKM